MIFYFQLSSSKSKMNFQQQFITILIQKSLILQLLKTFPIFTSKIKFFTFNSRAILVNLRVEVSMIRSHKLKVGNSGCTTAGLIKIATQ